MPADVPPDQPDAPRPGPQGDPAQGPGPGQPGAHAGDQRSGPRTGAQTAGRPAFKDELRDAVSLRATLLVLGVLLLQLAFTLSYIGAFHSPRPHRIPVGVVAPAPLADRLVTRLNALDGEPFRARTSPNETQASESILHRDLDAAIVVDPTRATDRLLVASAGGPAVSTVTTQIAQKIELGQRRTLRIIDLRPPDPQDGRGLSSFYLVLGWMIGGYLAASILGIAGGARPATLRRTMIRLGGLAPYAIASGLGGALVAGPILGTLPGHFWQLFGIGTLMVFSVAATTVAFQGLLGMLGVGLAIVLFVVIGNPSAGGAYPNALLPPFWRTVGPWLPPGAGTTTVRNTVYFTGHHTTGPLWVLGVYAAGGIAVALAVSALRARRGSRPSPAQPPAHSV